MSGGEKYLLTSSIPPFSSGRNGRNTRENGTGFREDGLTISQISHKLLGSKGGRHGVLREDNLVFDGQTTHMRLGNGAHFEITSVKESRATIRNFPGSDGARGPERNLPTDNDDASISAAREVMSVIMRLQQQEEGSTLPSRFPFMSMESRRSIIDAKVIGDECSRNVPSLNYFAACGLHSAAFRVCFYAFIATRGALAQNVNQHQN
jgi:hypothetical protein